MGDLTGKVLVCKQGVLGERLSYLLANVEAVRENRKRSVFLLLAPLASVICWLTLGVCSVCVPPRDNEMPRVCSESLAAHTYPHGP